MANLYVRSTDGSDADNGSTWALSKATLAGAAAIDAAGDTIYLSQAHSETTAAAITLAFAGTLASPVKVLGVDDGAEPPTGLSVLPAVSTTGASSISISGNAYCYGINFSSGSGSSNASVLLNSTGGGFQVYEKCLFKLNNTSTSSIVSLLASNGSQAGKTKIIDSEFRFNRADIHNIVLCGATEIVGGSVTSTSTFTGQVFSGFGSSGEGSFATIAGVDFSSMGSSVTLVKSVGASSAPGTIEFRNCKLPASWTGSLMQSGSTQAGWRVSMYNCDSADTNYRLWVEDFWGSIKSETTLVKSGGASDGVTALSWKMVTNSNANNAIGMLVTDSIVIWNSAVGTSKTLTIDILHDNATNLTDAEVWVEVEYLGTSGYPLGSLVSDQLSNPLSSAADQAASSATWTTTGLTNPNKQKLEVSFTPQEAGLVRARVYLAKPSYTIYVDPKAIIS